MLPREISEKSSGTGVTALKEMVKVLLMPGMAVATPPFIELKRGTAVEITCHDRLNPAEFGKNRLTKKYLHVILHNDQTGSAGEDDGVVDRRCHSPQQSSKRSRRQRCKPMSLRGYGIITAAFFTVAMAYAVRYGYGMLLPGMLDSWDISKTEAGIVYAAYFATYTICSPLLGLLSDRCDFRFLLTLFSALLAGGAFLMGFAASAPEAALFFALAGIGHAACWSPVVSLVQQWVDDRHRGKALAVATMGSAFGIACWSLLLPVIVAGGDWRAGWIDMGIFGLVVACINYLLIRNPASSPGEPGGSTGRRVLPGWLFYRRLLGSDTMWCIGLSYLLIGFAVLVPFTFLGLYAGEELGLQYSAATRLFSLIAIAGMAGKLVLGILSDRWGRVPVMMICGVCLGAGCLGLVHCGALWLKIVAVVLIGIGFGAVWPVYAAAAVDFFPRTAAGSVIGLWTFFMGIGSIVSPVVCGWSIDITGSYTMAFNMGFAVALLSVAALVPLVHRPRLALPEMP